MRSHLASRSAATALLLLLLLSGCSVDKGGPEEGGDAGLPQGHYLVTEDKDGIAGRETYFVVLPDSAWESVSYWLDDGGTVCGLSRIRGAYTLGDTGIALIELERGEDLEGCPVSQSDFDEYVWAASPTGTDFVMGIRAITAGSFEARGGFAGQGWRTFYRGPDPHGYYD